MRKSEVVMPHAIAIVICHTENVITSWSFIYPVWDLKSKTAFESAEDVSFLLCDVQRMASNNVRSDNKS